MIRHLVLVKFRADLPAAEKTAALADLAALQAKIPGITGFETGPNVSPEGLGRGYTDAFIVTFEDAAARDRYLANADHAAAGARLVAATEGGIGGLVVFDFEV